MPPSAQATYDVDIAQALMEDVNGQRLHPFRRAITAVIYFGLAAILLVAITTYNPFDTTPDTAGIGGVQNALGERGAGFANFVMQFMGWGSVLLGFLLLLAGMRTLLWPRLVRNRWDRAALIGLYVCCLLFGVATLSGFPIPQSWPMAGGLGGWIGDIFFLNIQGFLDIFNIPLSGLMTTLIVFMLSAFCFARIVGIVGKDLLDIMDAAGLVWAMFRMGIDRVVHIISRKYDGGVAAGEGPERDFDFAFADDSYATPKRRKRSIIRQAPSSESAAMSASTSPSSVSSPVSNSAPKRRKSVTPPKPTFKFDPNSAFTLPGLKLLKTPPARKLLTDEGALRRMSENLHTVLTDYGVKGEMGAVRPGPVVTLFEFEPAPGVKSQRVINLSPDIARNMSAESARIAVVPGRNAMGVELPNRRRETVWLQNMLSSDAYTRSEAALPLIMGEDIGGRAFVTDLAKMPHLLVAGTTGSGKSVAINAMILSLMYRLTPEECKFIMIDPKMLELSVYDGIPHLLSPVVTEPKKAVVALKWTVREMEDRYRRMSKMGVRNMAGYNEKVQEAKDKGEILTRTVVTGYDKETGEPNYETEELDFEPMAYIVVIIDEMADLMMVAGKDIEGAVQRLAQMARAAGIHMIMATQRPSVDVITGTIKANFPTRVSFRVGSSIDSRTILGEQGAEQLLGNGDMLFMGTGRPRRLHGPFVSDGEVEKIAAFVKAQGAPSYLEEITAEPDEDVDESGSSKEAGDLSLFDQAVAIVAKDRKASTSYIQRRLSIGYNRAANLIEQMEEEGMIGPSGAGGKREIFLPESSAY